MFKCLEIIPYINLAAPQHIPAQLPQNPRTQTLPRTFLIPATGSCRSCRAHASVDNLPRVNASFQTLSNIAGRVLVPGLKLSVYKDIAKGFVCVGIEIEIDDILLSYCYFWYWVPNIKG